MEWETPEFIEIRMDAEINAYQEDDYGPAGPNEPVISKEPQESAAG
jgi:coenzyme PQQ precursor peptide PqqA